jgi:3-oxoacyl-[acyl-carrier protein] reductase
MDLGIKGRRALVCAASKGLGRACAMALAREGVAVTITARNDETLERTASEIRAATGAAVTTVAGDITTEAGRAAALAACPDPDILVNNAGGPPPGDFREWDREHWIRALDANMLTPILLIRAVVDAMVARRFGRIVNITSAAVLSPIPRLGLSNGARTGLTGFIAGLSRQVARHHQQPAPRRFPHRPSAQQRGGGGSEGRTRRRCRDRRARTKRAGRPRRRPRGVRRSLRLPVRCPCRLHRRAQSADRRWRLQRHLCIEARAPAPQPAACGGPGWPVRPCARSKVR